MDSIRLITLLAWTANGGAGSWGRPLKFLPCEQDSCLGASWGSASGVPRVVPPPSRAGLTLGPLRVVPLPPGQGSRSGAPGSSPSLPGRAHARAPPGPPPPSRAGLTLGSPWVLPPPSRAGLTLGSPGSSPSLPGRAHARGSPGSSPSLPGRAHAGVPPGPPPSLPGRAHARVPPGPPPPSRAGLTFPAAALADSRRSLRLSTPSVAASIFLKTQGHAVLQTSLNTVKISLTIGKCPNTIFSHFWDGT